MKKLFVTVMALTVLGGVAFAQNGAQAARAAKDAQVEIESKTVMALTVLGGVASAQNGAQAARAAKVARATKDAQEEIEAKKADVLRNVEKTVAVAPRYANKDSLKLEAEKTFISYFTANPNGKVQEAAYSPLAVLLATAQDLNAMIARTPDAGQKEDYAIHFFFSQDIPGKYAALKAVNPDLAAATNELMRSFMGTVSNGTFYGGANHPDMQTMRAFKAEIGYR